MIKGKEGFRLYFKDIDVVIKYFGFIVNSIDIIGVGDVFMGVFLY